MRSTSSPISALHSKPQAHAPQSYLTARAAEVDAAMDGFLPKDEKPGDHPQGDALQPLRRRQTPAPRAPPRRRRSCGGRFRCPRPGLRRRVHPHLLAHPRRPPVHGRRRPAPRPAHLPQGLRRRHRRARGDALLTVAFDLSRKPRPRATKCAHHPRTRRHRRQSVAHRRPGRRPRRRRPQAQRRDLKYIHAARPPRCSPPRSASAP